RRRAAALSPEIAPYTSRTGSRSLQRQPALRYQRVAEILAALEAESFRASFRYEAARRRWIRPVAAGIAGVLLLAAGFWWAVRRAPASRASRPAASPEEAPAANIATRSVLISDFENKTGDPVFDGTLEHSFGLSLESATFISHFSRARPRQIA